MTNLRLGGVSGIFGNDYRGRDQSRDGRRRRDRSYSSSRSRSRGRRRGGKDTREQLIQSAKAAFLAGAGEAFRSRKEAGGPKGKRVLTAAVSAGAINAFLNSSKKDGQGGDKIRVAESVVGGLAINYLVNGSRHKNRSRLPSHSRGRRDGNDRNREGRDLAGQADRGVATAAGTASVNGNKSRDRRRRYSSSDYDSDGGQGKRGKSIGDLARAGMSKLGLRGDKSGDDPISRRDV